MRWVVALISSFCFASQAAAQLPRGKPVEYQYIEAIRAGDVDKARGLAKLANIDPHNVGGQPVITWVPRAPIGLLFLPPKSYDYLVGELGQSLDAPLWREQRTLFSTMCGFLAHRDHANGEFAEQDVWSRAIRTIEAAIASGVKTTAWPNAKPHMGSRQPFPECLAAYVRYQRHPTRRFEMLRVLGQLLDKGANVNERYWADGGGVIYPVFRAAATYDVELLKFLVDRGAILEFKGGDPRSTCPIGPNVINPLVRFVPNPLDADTERAKSFLTGLLQLGGDIRTAGTYRHYSAGDCHTAVKTLKERALDYGQLRYAQMVQDLEERASQIIRRRNVGRGQPPVYHDPKDGARTASAGAALSGSRMLTRSINLRGGAGLDGVIVGKMEAGTLVSVERMDGDWAFVTLRDGKRGWMHGETLQSGSHHVQ